MRPETLEPLCSVPEVLFLFLAICESAEETGWKQLSCPGCCCICAALSRPGLMRNLSCPASVIHCAVSPSQCCSALLWNRLVTHCYGVPLGLLFLFSQIDSMCDPAVVLENSSMRQCTKCQTWICACNIRSSIYQKESVLLGLLKRAKNLEMCQVQLFYIRHLKLKSNRVVEINV